MGQSRSLHHRSVVSLLSRLQNLKFWGSFNGSIISLLKLSQPGIHNVIIHFYLLAWDLNQGLLRPLADALLTSQPSSPSRLLLLEDLTVCWSTGGRELVNCVGQRVGRQVGASLYNLITHTRKWPLFWTKRRLFDSDFHGEGAPSGRVTVWKILIKIWSQSGKSSPLRAVKCDRLP